LALHVTIWSFFTAVLTALAHLLQLFTEVSHQVEWPTAHGSC